MKTLVTGGSGLVGKHLQDIMEDAIFLSSSDGNLLRVSDIEYLLKYYKPDVVVHLAARVGGVLDNINYPVEYLELNTLMTTNLLRVCHKYDVNRVIAMGSTCVYPDVMEEYPMKINLSIDINNGEIVRVYSNNTKDDVVVESLTISKSTNGKEQEVEFISYEDKE